MTARTPVEAWGFIGLGEMGEPMVDSLLSRGLQVICYDRDPARVRLCVARGAVPARGIAEVARRSQVVSVCVRDERQVEEVLEEGLLDGVSLGVTVLVHSTVGPRACRSAAARLAERGAAVLDAPVSGMRIAAAEGALTFYVGGAPEVVARVREGLDAMGRAVIPVGDVGAGQLVKVANNLVAFGTAGLVHEVIELAAAGGVHEDVLLDALGRGSARSWVAQQWPFLGRQWTESQPGGAGAVRDIVAKDLGLAMSVAGELGVNAPFASLAADVVPGVLGAER